VEGGEQVAPDKGKLGEPCLKVRLI